MGAAAVLTILKDGETVKSVPIENEVLVGRGDGCVIRLEDRAISRKHALFRKTGDAYQIEKQSEFAPISVNGAECTQAVLKEGDVISIGPYLMRFSMAAQQQQPEAPAAALEVAPAAEAIVLDTAPPDAAATAVLPQPKSEFGGVDFQIQSEPEGNEAQADQAAQQSAAVESQQQHEGGDATRVMSPQSSLDVGLVFKPGTANVTEYVITKDEVSIGRDKECDVVLEDKRASRKNSVIVRKGMDFIIRDLDSGNGTYVNGEKIQERQLSGNDVVTVGDTEFVFKAIQSGYEEKEKDFLAIPQESVSQAPEELPAFHMDSHLPQHQEVPAFVPATTSVPMDQVGLNHASAIPGISGISGIAGTAGKKLTLIEKYRALPKGRQVIVGVCLLALAYFLLIDEDPAPKKSAKSKNGIVAVTGATGASGAQAKAAAASFEALSPEQKKFVEMQHDLAFNYYKNRDYDKTLFEIGKIFAIVPDYKDSREIERYAKEGKRKLDALAEEKRKHDEELALKQKISDLVADGNDKMKAKKYDQAREIFSQILAIDPENKDVAAWNRILNDIEEEKKISHQRAMVQEEVNKQAWDLYKEGVAQRKQGKARGALSTFGKVRKIEAADRKPAALASRQIAEIEADIQTRLAPALQEAKQHDEQNEYDKAFAAYQKVLAIEPSHAEARKASERIRGVLREHAKTLYTEAILAESYSDFSTAKRKFKECLGTAPADDLYKERCERKLARYFKIEEAGGGGMGQ